MKSIINKKTIPLLLILTLAAFLRFYQLNQLAPFLGDQGRDLLEIYLSLKTGKLPLAGPLSNHDIHGGPIYYYLLIPSLLISNFNPLYPTYFLVLLELGSLFLLFKINHLIFNQKVAMLVALIYTTSTVTISRAQGIWNPEPIPFFTLLVFWSILQIHTHNKKIWFLILGVALSITIQLYSPTMFLLFPFIIWWLYRLSKNKQKQQFLKLSLLTFSSFLIILVPFLIFQFKTNFADFSNLISPAHNPSPPIRKIVWLQNFVIKSSLNFANQFISLTGLTKKAFPFPQLNLTFGSVLVLVILLNKQKIRFLLAIATLFILALSFFTLNLDRLPSHYIAFLWPIPFLLLGNLFSLIDKTKFKIVVAAISFVLIAFNLYSHFKNLKPQNDIKNTKEISSLILEQAEQKPFAILFYSRRSLSDSHFRYFLALENQPPEKIEEANLVFLICDQQPCPPLKNKVFVDSYCLPRCPDVQNQKQVILNNWREEKRTNYKNSDIVKLQKN